MEVTCLSSKGLASISCRPSFPSPTHSLARSPAVVTSTNSVLRVSPSSFLPIKLESSCPSTSSVYRSSMWGGSPIHYVANFGTVSLLLLAPGLFQKQAEPVERRIGSARAYREPTNPVLKFLNRVQGALPVVGLISRLVNPEGGIGTDRIRLEEFCTRVGRNCTREDSRAFYEIADRYGKRGKPPFVLIWCWAAALGAGLLRSEDLVMAASRLRVSYDIQFEVENFDLLMDEATKKRLKSGSKAPDVSMESRAEKALEGICKCCTGTTVVTEEDAPLFATILKAVFPSADKDQIDSIVASRLFDPLSATASNSENGQIVEEEEKEEEEEAGEGEGEEEEERKQPQSTVHELLQ